MLAAGPADLSPPTDQAGLRQALITGDRLSGFVLPIVAQETDLVMQATRTLRWKVDDTLRLALQGDVRISVAGYSFMARDALVWINRIPSAGGLITQVAMWFPKVAEPTRGAGVGVAGSNVLVTASLRGGGERLTGGGEPARARARKVSRAAPRLHTSHFTPWVWGIGEAHQGQGGNPKTHISKTKFRGPALPWGAGLARQAPASPGEV